MGVWSDPSFFSDMGAVLYMMNIVYIYYIKPLFYLLRFQPPVAQPVKMEGPVFSPTSATVLLAGGGPFVKVVSTRKLNHLVI